MEEDRWTHQDCTVFESPGSTQEPFTYVFRVERGGSEVFRYTLKADTLAIKAHWPDVDPTRLNDMDVVWSHFPVWAMGASGPRLMPAT